SDPDGRDALRGCKAARGRAARPSACGDPPQLPESPRVDPAQLPAFLKVQPELRNLAQDAPEHHSHLRGHPAPPAADLVDLRSRHAEVPGEHGLGKTTLFQDVLEHGTGMYRNGEVLF